MEVKLYFATVDFKRNIKTLESPIGLLYLLSMVISTPRIFVYPNKVS